jgi:hypothetical protein
MVTFVAVATLMVFVPNVYEPPTQNVFVTFKLEASLKFVPVHVRPLMVLAAGVLIHGDVPVMFKDQEPDVVPLYESKFDEHDTLPLPDRIPRTPIVI